MLFDWLFLSFDLDFCLRSGCWLRRKGSDNDWLGNNGRFRLNRHFFFCWLRDRDRDNNRCRCGGGWRVDSFTDFIDSLID